MEVDGEENGGSGGFEPPPMQRSMSVASGQSSGRFEKFSEAVPLALSSMAHASIPLEDGVLDGIRQVLHHTLLSCVNYARMMIPPHQWTFRDLATSPYAWQPCKSPSGPTDQNFFLQRFAFKHEYTRSALIYLKTAVPEDLTAEGEREMMNDWRNHPGILGRITLKYVSTEILTPEEMNGTETDEMPPCILSKAEVEYRSLPATGKQIAVQAEELSMLSFGGSVDDDVKYGALASLYDRHAKYVLEIYSVRGRKYKFDLMDSTLSDGTIPRLPSSRDGDPFVKSLCVTVTTHSKPEENHSNDKKEYAVTRMQLLLEGKPRNGGNFDNLPPFNLICNGIRGAFLLLNPEPMKIVTAMPSGHALLMDPAHAGRVYVNGTYVTTWGQDPRIGSHGIALFGMDLHSIPFWHGRIIDYEALKMAYAQLWHEVLIDARLFELNIGSCLLARLITGKDNNADDDDEDLYDEDEADASIDTDVDCLETQVMSDSHYDRVGIAPKALATRFSMDHGRDAFPCMSHEVEWVKHMLPDRNPVVVPFRLIKILRRGGYFNTQQTADELWFSETRPVKDGPEKAMVSGALQLLAESGCEDIAMEQIAFISRSVARDIVSQKAVCRFSEAAQQYCIHEHFLDVAVAQYLGEMTEERDDMQVRSYLLGMYLAKEHPNGSVLVRYLLRNKASV